MSNVDTIRERFVALSLRVPAERNLFEEISTFVFKRNKQELRLNRILVMHMWSAIIARYSEEHRAYHDMSHIEHLLTLFDDVRHLLKTPDAVETAIYFHDLIYDTSSKTNEEDSAFLAKTYLDTLQCGEGFTRLVVQHVASTKKHEWHGQPADTAYFLDMDLAILGAMEDVFKKYDDGIRKEYVLHGGVSPWLYRSERAKVLKSFLDRENIFFTPYFRERFDAQARANLAHTIEMLKEKA